MPSASPTKIEGSSRGLRLLGDGPHGRAPDHRDRDRGADRGQARHERRRNEDPLDAVRRQRRRGRSRSRGRLGQERGQREHEDGQNRQEQNATLHLATPFATPARSMRGGRVRRRPGRTSEELVVLEAQDLDRHGQALEQDDQRVARHEQHGGERAASAHPVEGVGEREERQEDARVDESEGRHAEKRDRVREVGQDRVDELDAGLERPRASPATRPSRGGAVRACARAGPRASGRKRSSSDGNGEEPRTAQAGRRKLLGRTRAIPRAARTQ